jgi:hypothetical protein
MYQSPLCIQQLPVVDHLLLPTPGVEQLTHMHFSLLVFSASLLIYDRSLSLSLWVEIRQTLDISQAIIHTWRLWTRAEVEVSSLVHVITITNFRNLSIPELSPSCDSLTNMNRRLIRLKHICDGFLWSGSMEASTT